MQNGETTTRYVIARTIKEMGVQEHLGKDGVESGQAARNNMTLEVTSPWGRLSL
jgi:hypothetical protein